MVSWLPVVGYEGLYEVSDSGLIRSLNRTVTCSDGRPLRITGCTLATYRTPPMGYQAVKLSKGGKKRAVRVHSIVLEAFVGPRPDGLVACHNNGDMDDLSAGNLRWDTQANNLQDKMIHGTHHNVNKTHCKRGHPFDAANTYLKKDGGRQCRQCERSLRQARKKSMAACTP